MGVAARVAEEMGVALGREVGYSIRFEEVAVPVRADCCIAGVHEADVHRDNADFNVAFILAGQQRAGQCIQFCMLAACDWLLLAAARETFSARKLIG
jgi:hypothetical protein